MTSSVVIDLPFLEPSSSCSNSVRCSLSNNLDLRTKCGSRRLELQHDGGQPEEGRRRRLPDEGLPFRSDSSKEELINRASRSPPTSYLPKSRLRFLASSASITSKRLLILSSSFPEFLQIAQGLKRIFLAPTAANFPKFVPLSSTWQFFTRREDDFMAAAETLTNVIIQISMM